MILSLNSHVSFLKFPNNFSIMILHSLVTAACIHHYFQGCKLVLFLIPSFFLYLLVGIFLKEKLSFVNYFVTSRLRKDKFLILFFPTPLKKSIYGVMSRCSDSLQRSIESYFFPWTVGAHLYTIKKKSGGMEIFFFFLLFHITNRLPGTRA